MKFFEAVDNLLDTYSSIDARVCAFMHEGVWKTAFLILRFRHETQDQVKKQHDQLLDKIGRIEEKDFCVKLYVLPISNWKLILENWYKNFICFEPNFAVNFDRQDDVNFEITHPQLYYWDHSNIEWKSYSVESRASKKDIRPILAQHDGKARSLNSKSMEFYLSIALSIDEQQIHNNGEGTHLLVAPIFFNINNIEFTGNSILLTCTGYPDKIRVVVDFYKDRSGSNPWVWKDRIDIPQVIKNESNDYRFKIECPVPDLDVTDGFRIIVYRENDVILQENNLKTVGSHWHTKSSTTNPIYPIFKEFVTINEWRKMLLESESKTGKRASSNFEKGVSWLLSILGLNSIWLGDDFQYSGINEDRSSIDVLAHNGATHIFLVNATAGIPDLSSFARERRSRENLQNKIKNSELMFTSILFSNAMVTNLIESANLEGVILIGKTEIETLLNLIEAGNNDLAREYIVRERITF